MQNNNLTPNGSHSKLEMEFHPDYYLSLKKDFFRRNTILVARDLIGKALVKQEEYGDETIAAVIVETEAYRAGEDLACHATPGKSARNAALFSNGGVLYVYKIYGIHFCVNMVTEFDTIGSGVLIRAAMPVLGIEIMKRRRNTHDINTLCKGPGNLAKAFDFNTSDNFHSLTEPSLFVQPYFEIDADMIAASSRIGVNKSADLPYRFFLKNNPYVSGRKY